MANQTFLWIYYAYGLRLESEIQIPSLLPETVEYEAEILPDNDKNCIAIQLDTALAIEQMIPDSILQKSIAVRVQGHEIILYLKNIGVFSVRQGKAIRCHLIPDVDFERFSLALLGVVMSALLFQRKCFIAHGSAVAIAGEGILFLGNSGAGKSSLAIALHQRGYPIMTDDLAGITDQDGVPHLLPAFPQMRVTQESADALGLPWENLIELPTLSKRGFRFEAEFIPHAIPLRHIYVLKTSQDKHCHCRPLEHHQRIMELMHHSEAMSLFEAEKTAHFRACANLARTVPIDYFQRSMSWDTLQTSLNILERHVSSS